MKHTDYYIYCYYDTRTNPHTPIYIGRGRKDRYLQHYKKTHNKYFYNKLKSIKEETGSHAIVLKLEENLTNEQANEKEIYYISLYGRVDLNTGTLCNLTNGGEATDGWKPSEATKQLWSQQRKGKKQTEAQYKANCSRVLTEEQKQAARERLKLAYEATKGKPPSKEQIAKYVETRISKRENILNKTFKDLTVLSIEDNTNREYAICSCSCGNPSFRIMSYYLRTDKITKCSYNYTVNINDEGFKYLTVKEISEKYNLNKASLNNFINKNKDLNDVYFKDIKFNIKSTHHLIQ